MNSIANAIISFLELLEAEGRNFREKTVAAAEKLMLVFFAFALFFAGTIVMSCALCLWLTEYIGKIGAIFTVAVLLLTLGGITFVKARGGVRSGKEEAEADGETISVSRSGETHGEK